MVFIQGIFTALSRFAGKILNTAFGWAVQMLYGRVSKDNQMLLNGMAFGAVLWLVALIGVIYPPFGVWLLSFVRLPDWVHMEWIRLAMLAAAILLPLVIGFLASKLGPAESETKVEQTSFRQSIGQGYRLTAGIAVTLIMLTIIAPMIKIRAILKRWTSQEVPVIMEPQDYLNTVDILQKNLASAGWKVSREKAGSMLTLPMRALGFFTNREQPKFVAEHLTVLSSDKLEVLVHPSYLSMSGPEAEIAPVRALLVESLTFSPVHMTWDKEAMELEDRLEAVWNAMKSATPEEIKTGGMKRLKEIEADIRKLDIPFEEWEVLYRIKLWVENALLRVMSGDEPLTEANEITAISSPPVIEEQHHQAKEGGVFAIAGNLAVLAAFFGTLWASRSRR